MPEIRQLSTDSMRKTQATCPVAVLHTRRACRFPCSMRIVYGPVRSRRLGASLGINLLPAGRRSATWTARIANTDGRAARCATADRELDGPRSRLVEAAVAARLTIAAERNEVIDRLTLAGHGEPTLHPEFEDDYRALQGRCAIESRRVCRLRFCRIRRRRRSTTSGAVSADCDERYMKLDAGDAITFADVNGGGRHLSDVLDGLRSLSPISFRRCSFVTLVASSTIRATRQSARGSRRSRRSARPGCTSTRSTVRRRWGHSRPFRPAGSARSPSRSGRLAFTRMCSRPGGALQLSGRPAAH